MHPAQFGCHQYPEPWYKPGSGKPMHSGGSSAYPGYKPYDKYAARKKYYDSRSYYSS